MESRDALQILPEEVWSMLLKYLVAGQDLLTSRHVCKIWKEGVDRYLQSEQLNLDYTSLDSHNCRFFPFMEMRITKDRFLNTQSTTKMLQKFHRHFKDHPDNPLVSRSVNIGLDDLDSYVLTFFEQYGKHIWYLTFSMEQTGTLDNQLDIAKFLCNVLKHTPDVKLIKLKISQNLFNQNYDLNNEKTLLKAFLESQCLPDLPRLQNLETRIDPHLCIIQEYLEKSYAPQLKYYTQYGPIGLEHVDLQPNLQKFCWSISHPRKYENPLILDKLQKFPNITKLCLDIVIGRYLTDCYSLCPTSIFLAIEKHTKSLKTFSISLDTPLFDFPVKCNMPMLETLCLSFKSPVVIGKLCLSFLKYLVNLKTLQLHFYRKILTDWSQNSNPPKTCSHTQNDHLCNFDNQEIDLFQNLDHIDTFWNSEASDTSNLHNSNIWTHVESLQTINMALIDNLRHACNYSSRFEGKKLFRTYRRETVSQ